MLFGTFEAPWDSQTPCCHHLSPPLPTPYPRLGVFIICLAVALCACAHMLLLQFPYVPITTPHHFPLSPLTLFCHALQPTCSSLNSQSSSAAQQNSHGRPLAGHPSAPQTAAMTPFRAGGAVTGHVQQLPPPSSTSGNGKWGHWD